LDRGEDPGSVEHLWSRLVEADGVVPAFHDREQVRPFIVAAEVDGDRAVVVLGRGEVVDAVGVAVVRLEVAVCVVDGDRPEAVYGTSRTVSE
jgi:hypothetical protein